MITAYTPTSEAAARAAKNYVRFATDFGPERTSYWQGVDLTLRARLGRQLNVQLGTSTGRSYVDRCDTSTKVDSPDPRGCLSKEPYQTTLRGLASYTVPTIDVLVS